MTTVTYMWVKDELKQEGIRLGQSFYNESDWKRIEALADVEYADKAKRIAKRNGWDFDRLKFSKTFSND